MVSNANGTASKTLQIKVLEIEEEKILPVADFNTNVTEGYAPLRSFSLIGHKMQLVQAGILKGTDLRK